MTTLLVIGSEKKRSYAMKTFSQMGIRTVLLDGYSGYSDFRLVDETICCKPTDPPSVLKAVQRFQNGGGVIDGVVTFMEPLVESTAILCDALQLPGLHPEAARRARNKHLMRQAFSEHRVSSPQSLVVNDLQELKGALGVIGLPSVLKPVDGTASVGVVKLESWEQFLALDWRDGKPRLLESYINGPEVSVEGVVHDTEVYMAAITDKQTTQGPFFVETGHSVPTLLDDRTKAAIEDLARRAVLALGLNNCGFHAEIKLEAGQPYVMEVAARLGGDYIVDLVSLATGVNLYEQLCHIALGKCPNMRPSLNASAAVRFLNAQDNGVVTEITGVWEALNNVHDLIDIQIPIRRGQSVQIPQSNFDRLGHVIVRSPNPDISRREAELVVQGIQIKTVPTQR